MENRMPWAEEAFQIGFLRGRTQVFREVSERVLRRRFGELPEVLVNDIQRLSTAALDELVEEVLDFRSLAEVEAWVIARL